MSDLKSILMSADPSSELRVMHAAGDLAALEPTLAALEMTAPKGYHHKDVLDHSFVVLDHAMARSDKRGDLILRTAALFHDIGKPDTREFHTKGKVSFTNHDFVGSKITRRILRAHGYSKDEIEKVSTLVAMHMRSHTFKSGWNDSAVRRLITQSGSEEQLERLIAIFYSDATTKHEHKKAAIHRNVDELSVELARIKKNDARASLRPALNGVEVSELFGIPAGRELGRLMKFLNRDENIVLDREDAVTVLRGFVSAENDIDEECC